MLFYDFGKHGPTFFSPETFRRQSVTRFHLARAIPFVWSVIPSFSSLFRPVLHFQAVASVCDELNITWRKEYFSSWWRFFQNASHQGPFPSIHNGQGRNTRLNENIGSDIFRTFIWLRSDWPKYKISHVWQFIIPTLLLWSCKPTQQYCQLPKHKARCGVLAGMPYQ